MAVILFEGHNMEWKTKTSRQNINDDALFDNTFFISIYSVDGVESETKTKRNEQKNHLTLKRFLKCCFFYFSTVIIIHEQQISFCGVFIK